jgi:hypothetical protein
VAASAGIVSARSQLMITGRVVAFVPLVAVPTVMFVVLPVVGVLNCCGMRCRHGSVKIISDTS